MNRLFASCLIAALLMGLPGCMTEAEKKVQSERMFRDYCDAWSSTRNIDTLLSFFANDCIYENIPRERTYHGKDGVRSYARACFEAIPDLKLEATSVFVSGDWLACEWVMTGTQSGVTADFPGTGQSFTVRGSSIVQLRGGKIFRNADYWDMATFMRHTGVTK